MATVQSLKRASSKPAAGIYARISSDPQGIKAGVKRQQEDCLRLAEGRGWPVVETYVDNDLSAWSGKTRPEYQRMLEDLQSGHINAVVVWHLDRLHRHPKELEEFFEVVETAGVSNLATVTGDINLASGDGRLHARIMGAVAKKESDDKSRRIKRKHEELARDGRPLGGVTTPFGYRYDPDSQSMTPHPAEAKIVKQIFQRYAAGWGLRKIARDLTDRGIVGRRGRTRWTNGAITKILDNPTFAGWRHYECELTKGQWKPIIDQQLFDDVKAMRLATQAPTPAQNRLGKGANLLSGLLYCSCGAPMWRDTQVRDQSKSAYKCAKAASKRRGSCTAGTVSALRVEREILKEFLALVSDPYTEHARREGPRLVHSGEAEGDDEKKLEQIDRKIERAVEVAMQTAGPASDRVIRKKLEALEAERAEVELEIAKGRASNVRDIERAQRGRQLLAELPRLDTVWERLETAERHEILQQFLVRAEVMAGPRPKQIRVEWASWLTE